MSSSRAIVGPVWTRRSLISVLLVVIAFLAVPPAGAHAPLGAAPAPLASHSAASTPVPAVSPPAPLSVRPATALSGTFFQNVSSFSSVPAAQQPCGPFFYYCYNEAQSPTLLRLANGSIGIGFSQVTRATTSTCPNAISNTSIRVAFSVSKDGGRMFSSPLNLGNNTCPFIQALEPSFAVGHNGKIYGAFVEANDSPSSFIPSYGSPIIPYTVRPMDALALVTSSNNGTSFSVARTLVSGGNIARPAIATFGNSVYIVYENISNGTSILPGALSSTPIAIHLVYSNDNGTTWHGPYNLPGRNASAFNNAMSPSITVSSNGTVIVAYATDRSCLGWCGAAVSFYLTYGENITIATSLSNGTTFTKPKLVAPYVGECPQYQSNYVAALWQWTPQTTVAVTPGGTIYVGWSGGYNQSVPPGPAAVNLDWISSEVHVAVSTNGGNTWTDTRVSAALPPSASYMAMEAFNPSVSVAPNGTLFLTYTQSNQTLGCGYNHNYLAPAYWQDIRWSPDGIRWGPDLIPAVSHGTYGYESYPGYTASIIFNATGGPIVAYAIDTTAQYGIGGGLVTLEVATMWAGASTTITFHENGLTAGASWSFNVNGNIYTSTLTTQTLTLPIGVPLLVEPQGPAKVLSYATIVQALVSLGEVSTFTTPTSDYLNFTTFYGIQFNVEPRNTPYFYMQIANNSPSGYNFNFGMGTYNSPYGQYTYTYGCPFLWYFAAGTHFSFTIGFGGSGTAYASYFSQMPIAFWNGTGASSYTGSTAYLNLTVNSPINETGWAEPWGLYSTVFHARGLPSTSVYQFTLDGSVHSAAATKNLTVANVSTGAHWLDSIFANSSLAGWEYFGSADTGNPLLVPYHVDVNLTFAFVHVAAAFGPVSFHATGLTNGTVWRFSVNGTTYSSSTPWINVSLQPGTYPVGAFPVVAQNGSVGFTPTGVGPTMSVTTNSVYPISFTQAYKVTAEAGLGGTVTPSGSAWVASGAAVSLLARVSTAGFLFGGWSGTGVGSYTGSNVYANFSVGGPITEVAAFYPAVANRFNLTFTETTLPAGTWWGVQLNGVGYSTNGSFLVIPQLYSCAFSGNLGRYTVTVPYAYQNGSGLTRYVPAIYNGKQCAGTGVPVVLTFVTQYYFTLQSTAGGTVTAQWGTQTEYGPFWETGSTSVALQAVANNGYNFIQWNGTGPGNYSGNAASPSFTPTGPVTELAVFGFVNPSATPRYHLTFTLASPSAFAAGTAWSVVVGTTNYTSTTNQLIVPNLVNGPVKVGVATDTAPSGLTQYWPISPPQSVTVNGNTTQSLSFRTYDMVTVRAAGPGSVGPASGWHAEGTQFALSASPSVGDIFVGWVGTGTTGYSGPDPNGTVTVNGPVTEVATFAPASSATKSVTSTWSNPALLAGLAIAGLLVGLVVGVLAMRLRGRAKSPPPPADATSPAEPEAPMYGHEGGRVQ